MDAGMIAALAVGLVVTIVGGLAWQFVRGIGDVLDLTIGYQETKR